MGYNTANGVIIYDHCILLFLSHPLSLGWHRGDEEGVLLHLVIYM